MTSEGEEFCTRWRWHWHPQIRILLLQRFLYLPTYILAGYSIHRLYGCGYGYEMETVRYLYLGICAVCILRVSHTCSSRTVTGIVVSGIVLPWQVTKIERFVRFHSMKSSH